MSYKFFELDSQYHLIKNKLEQRLKKLLDHKQFINGPEVSELEKQLEKYMGIFSYALATNSGTSALLLSLMVLDLNAGDEIITSPVSFGATANVIRFVGAVPVFVDIEKDTGLINVHSIKKAISDKSKVILPVSLYGQPADMDQINEIARTHNLKVVEDACQSFGALYKGKKSGSLSDLSATSFFPAKPLGAYGNSGCVFTNNKKYVEKMKKIRNHGQSERFTYELLGFNGLMNSFQAIVLLEKLIIFEKELKLRQELASRYDEAIKNLAPDITLLPIKKNRTSARNYYVLRSRKRKQIMDRFRQEGRPLTIHYPMALFDQPVFKNCCKIYGNPDKTRQYMSEVFSLPLYPYLKAEDQNKTVQLLKEAIC